MINRKLRFAGLVRVSTPGQKEGASMETQENHIKEWVKVLGGTPSEIRWYTGQEPSTEGYERKICDQLLADAKRGKFDAVIVYDLSRWSRDTLRSRENLQTLRKHGIKFFDGMKEYNLEDDDDIFFITIMTAIYEREAKKNKARMQDGKITRADQGWAVSSPKRLPWGRTFDNDKKKDYDSVYDRWGLKDGEKEKMIRIVDGFLGGEKTKVLADELDMWPSNLLEVFRNRLGKVWKRKFKLPGKKGQYVERDIPMPPLIDDEEKIKKVKDRIESNKTWTHGSYKHDYIFNSFIFDKNCGHALTGTTQKGIAYYYHQDSYKKSCGLRKYFREKDLEPILSHLFYTYENEEEIERAVRKEYPDRGEYEKLMAEDASDSKEILKLNREEDTIAKATGEGVMKFDVAKRRLDKIEERIKLFEMKIEKRKPLLANLPPTKDAIERDTRFMRLIARRVLSSPSRLTTMSFQDKRRLVELAFDGKDNKGNKLGIYIEQGSTEGSFRYTVRAKFSKYTSGELPMSLSDIQKALKIDPDYEGSYNPFDEVEKEEAKRKGKKSLCQHSLT